MADPITPNTPNVDGQVITIFMASTVAAGAQSVSLPSYAPKFDIRVGHPILSMAAFAYETNIQSSEIFAAADEMARGTAPDGTGEWDIEDLDTVKIYRGADKNFILMITYLAFGSQQT